MRIGLLGVLALLLCVGPVTAPFAAPLHSPPPFQPTNDLERLLMAAATDPDQRPAFMRAMLAADLCGETDLTATPGAHTAAAGERHGLATVTLHDGAVAVALFTAPGRVDQVFGPGARALCANGTQMLGSLRGHTVVLNPGLAYGVVWSPDDLDGLLGVSRVVKQPTAVQLATPAQPPQALIARLKATFGAEPAVKAVWLSLAYWPDQQESSWYVDVRTTLDNDHAQALLRAAVAGVDTQGKPVDMVVNPLDGGPGHGLLIVNH